MRQQLDTRSTTHHATESLLVGVATGMAGASNLPGYRAVSICFCLLLCLLCVFCPSFPSSSAVLVFYPYPLDSQLSNGQSMRRGLSKQTQSLSQKETRAALRPRSGGGRHPPRCKRVPSVASRAVNSAVRFTQGRSGAACHSGRAVGAGAHVDCKEQHHRGIWKAPNNQEGGGGECTDARAGIAARDRRERPCGADVADAVGSDSVRVRRARHS